MGIIYAIGGLIAIFVITQSIVFLARALKRGKAMGMDPAKLKKIVSSSAIFAIVPSIPIITGLAILMPTIGLALSWIRLTVIGAVQYELYVATAVAPVDSLGDTIPLFDALTGDITGALATALLIMTVAILSGMLGNIFILKKYGDKLDALRKKNKKWMEILTMSMFMGIIAALGGQEIALGILGFFDLIQGGTGAGMVSLLVLFSSAGIMAVFGALIYGAKLKFLEGFALPISMLGAILLAYVYIPIFS